MAHLVGEPHPTIQRIHLDPIRLHRVIPSYVFEQEDEGTYRSECVECVGVEGVEVVLLVSVEPDLDRHTHLNYTPPLEKRDEERVRATQGQRKGNAREGGSML